MYFTLTLPFSCYPRPSVTGDNLYSVRLLPLLPWWNVKRVFRQDGGSSSIRVQLRKPIRSKVVFNVTRTEASADRLLLVPETTHIHIFTGKIHSDQIVWELLLRREESRLPPLLTPGNVRGTVHKGSPTPVPRRYVSSFDKEGTYLITGNWPLRDWVNNKDRKGNDLICF